jgi:hypothetical protein
MFRVIMKGSSVKKVNIVVWVIACPNSSRIRWDQPQRRRLKWDNFALKPREQNGGWFAF